MRKLLLVIIATSWTLPVLGQASGHVREKYEDGLLKYYNSAGTVIYSINIVITATTAASTDIIVQHPELTVTTS